jgi:hypothetical protein
MSPKPPAIAGPVALAKVRHHLAGLRGFNPKPEAEALLARTVQAVCISVEHVDAVLSSFDNECPTPREIKDIAWSTRPKFEPKVDQYREWERQYGPPDKQWSENLIKQADQPASKPTMKEWGAERRAMRLKAIRDTLYYTEGAGRKELDAIVGRQERNTDKAFWTNALRFHEREHPEEVAAIRAGREPEIPKEPELPPERRITAAMMRAVEPVRHERCPKCGGSGMLAYDEFCDCKMGEALRRLKFPPHGSASPAA